MRVVQLLPELNEGGVERGVVELSRELVKRGGESFVISNGGRLAKQIVEDGGQHITYDVCSKNILTVPTRIIGLRRLLHQLNPDIVHARSRVPAWLAYFANRSGNLPFITTVHGFNSVNAYSRIMTKGDTVICVSTSIASHVQKYYGVSKEKTVVIPRGVDLELFDPAKVNLMFMTDFSRKHNLQNRFVVTSVGRITQLKDLETFIRSISLLRKNVPNVIGLIVGGVRNDKKKYLEQLEALVVSLNLGNHICFAGSQSQMPEIYALSQVVVSCSKKPESFGRSAAEALAMNVPVVATGHGGILDIVRDGETGFLVPLKSPQALADAIYQCLDLSKQSLRAFIAENFTLERMVRTTYALYEKLSRGNR